MVVDENTLQDEMAKDLFFEQLEKELWDVKVNTATINNVTHVSCEEFNK